MKQITSLLLFALLATAPRTALADGYPAKTILDSGVNVVGEKIVYPTTGPANVKAAIVIMAPGEKTIVHKHGVPLFAYVLEGELTVDYEGHGKRIYRTGAAFLEAMHVWHYGINAGTVPVKLLAVYMGAKGSENVIPKR
jgi:quercetin dioxygenase-like cupin family protein